MSADNVTADTAEAGLFKRAGTASSCRLEIQKSAARGGQPIQSDPGSHRARAADGLISVPSDGIALRLCGKPKGVKSRALLVAQFFLKLGNSDLDRLHRNPGAVEPSLDDLQAR